MLEHLADIVIQSNAFPNNQLNVYGCMEIIYPEIKMICKSLLNVTIGTVVHLLSTLDSLLWVYINVSENQSSLKKVTLLVA